MLVLALVSLLSLPLSGVACPVDGGTMWLTRHVEVRNGVELREHRCHIGHAVLVPRTVRR